MENYKEKQNLPEEVTFSELMAAEKEVDTILEEINEIFRSTDDRKKAENLVLESHARRLEEAQRKAGEALGKWLSFVRSEIEKE